MLNDWTMPESHGCVQLALNDVALVSAFVSPHRKMMERRHNVNLHLAKNDLALASVSSKYLQTRFENNLTTS